MTRPIRLAVVGAGSIGRRHIDLIRSNPQCSLAAVIDPAPMVIDVTGSAGARVWEDLGAFLGAERVDGVIVATPNAMHLEHGLACIAAGTAVLIEKPIATSVPEGLMLAEAAESAGVPLLVGHHRRHSPIIPAARDIIRRGTLGDIVAVTGMALFHKPAAYFDAAPWRREPGGGPVLINMIHEVDDLRALCGEIVQVEAMGSSGTRGHAVEDTVAVLLRFASGALGTFMLSDVAAAPWSWEATSGEDASYPSYPDEDCYLIAGTRGSLAVPTLRMWLADGAPSWNEPLGPTVVSVDQRVDPLARQLDHFCEVIRGESQPLVSGRDATETLRVTLEIGQAAAGARESARGADHAD